MQNEEFSAQLQNLLKTSGARHAALLVERGGKTVCSMNIRASTASPFLIASITKVITATAVMVLVDQGAVSLDDSIKKYLPEPAQVNADKITIRHLLTHTSGLPRHVPDNVDIRKRQGTLRDFYESATNAPLIFNPGSRYSYSNVGYLLLRQLVERVSNKSLGDFTLNHIFMPLGMTGAAYGLGYNKLRETVMCELDSMKAYAGTEADEAWNWNSQYWRSLGAPWGGVIASARDMIKFMTSFLTLDKHPVLSRSSAQAMLTNQLERLEKKQGLGFNLDSSSFPVSAGTSVFGHSGATGVTTWAHVESGVVFVIFTSRPYSLSKDTIIKPISKLVFDEFCQVG
ncbi:MAG: serine hydrolase [Candidatus Buchananbacteria bacterium CG10_big_fil_rev_8_21_14_0_10_42_9]|uniref:Serine hydrolase n=1 Tax=Candidatus Buchananbacteria bacterium CG10_big_fil_rev_8_21_14_0_10_42_9 TaxID=1974526 RepID=A0A2H0W3K1_9BACT|nr:MAG: serine hydrolase [Candidatus Buchananbacteria bacterium CG10_big_fil_rev_8_21_14_0_10_42_9]